jgi:hypothetical protein
MSSDARALEYKEADRQAAKEPAHGPVIATPRARAGVTGHNVRYVLVFGIAAVVVAFVIVYLVSVG